jgi:hypothetical protein
MTMGLINRLKILADKQTDQADRQLLYDVATFMHVCEIIGQTVSRACGEIHSDIGRMNVSESVAAEIGNLRIAALAMQHVTNTMNGRSTLHYDEMDVDDPPKKVKLEVCPHCYRPGVVRETKKYALFVHSAWVWRDGKKTMPRFFCKLYANGNVDFVGRSPEMSLHRWSRYGHAVIEQVKGSYKKFRDPDDPSTAEYPLEGVTYPTDYGYLMGHTGEDGDGLDVFLGNGQDGEEYGRFFVYRPDVDGEVETKFYLGLTPDERAAVFAAFGPVLRGTPETFMDQASLQAALAKYRGKEVPCST